MPNSELGRSSLSNQFELDIPEEKRWHATLNGPSVKIVLLRRHLPSTLTNKCQGTSNFAVLVCRGEVMLPTLMNEWIALKGK